MSESFGKRLRDGRRDFFGSQLADALCDEHPLAADEGPTQPPHQFVGAIVGRRRCYGNPRQPAGRLAPSHGEFSRDVIG
ncbi:MAG: hypothetical protein ABIZ57_09090 [Candidatus Limnocylindria bacterium]